MTAHNNITLPSRLAGAVLGHLVGDAMGVPYEFGPPMAAEDVVFGHTGSHHQPAGTWSDDGGLMLALLDSLLRAGFNPEDQGKRALSWYREGKYTPDAKVFDIGNTTWEAMAALQSRTPALDAGPTDERACGNGSLMRILPVALVWRDVRPARLVEKAHLASRVTHGHPRCQVACAVYCLAVTALLRGQSPEDALAWAFSEYPLVCGDTPELEHHGGAFEELRTWTGRRGRGFVVDSFWSAWDAFAGATDYADTIRRAIAYGGDTDTTAAIAGGLAGARWGWESIPLEWRRGMRGHAIAQPLVDHLIAKTTDARTSTGSPLRVDELDLAGTAAAGLGRAGVTFLPGKKHQGYSGDHWRDLDLDLAHLRELGVDALFLLVEDGELDSCHVPELPAVMAADGPELIRFPITDTHLPADPIAYREAIADLARRVRTGEFIAIACRGGIDRSGMSAACLYREIGLDFNEAIRRTQAARHNSIKDRHQQAVVRAWPPTA
jgi:ADP-ribosylglycohydrolase